jgi:hypothetical protein
MIARYRTALDQHLADPLVLVPLVILDFLCIHPFPDGNGRMARAVGDLALARAEGTAQRYYSLSAQMQRERKDYYDQLERTQKGTLDVTEWLEWFLGCLLRAVQGAQETLSAVLGKANFWRQWADTPMNERQIKLLNQLLDGFDGKLTTSKWAAIANVGINRGDFSETPGFNFARTDRTLDAGIRLSYQPRRWLTAILAYEHEDYATEFADPAIAKLVSIIDYQVNNFTLSINLGY